jgi:predicted Zn-dependent protease
MSRKQDILQLVAQEPNDDFLNYALAIEEESEGNYSEAIHILLNIKQRNASYLPLYLKLAQLYANTNDTEKAIEAINEGIPIAQQLKNKRTEGELKELLLELED